VELVAKVYLSDRGNVSWECIEIKSKFSQEEII